MPQDTTVVSRAEKVFFNIFVIPNTGLSVRRTTRWYSSVGMMLWHSVSGSAGEIVVSTDCRLKRSGNTSAKQVVTQDSAAT